MFLAIVATKNNPTGEYDTKKFQKLYERFRDSKAPDNVTPGSDTLRGPSEGGVKVWASPDRCVPPRGAEQEASPRGEPE